MKHYDELNWRLYVTGQVPASETSMMELHLYQCDSCLTLYMNSLEECSQSLPAPDPDNFDDLNAILEHTMRAKPVWYRSTLFHYGVAAAATLILVTTGFFHGLTSEVGTLNERGFSIKSTVDSKDSMSSLFVDRTLTWLDHIEASTTQGGH